MPLHTTPDGTGWGTTTWNLRRDRLYLTPGDSPIGLRLPLDSLTWWPLPVEFERSPFEQRGDLPPAGTQPVGPAAIVERHECPPTAIAVEASDGHVRVFLPPLERAEHVVELLAVVESVADELECPVVVEGYPLPRDPRLTTLVVTPDPGVIEVNVQPSSSWRSLRTVVETLYEEARLTRLGTEKFSLDGTHTGTGGGNHVTLGGATPADSPLLRRPDLLRSMVTFWQHHPSMSYLFSGQFIGPTSQAPRVDEGRIDTVYELEIAFAELERQGPDVPPWMVDRLLRHLLVDLTGNTHRSEFCVDKLFSPDSERGRLGILELRAFEMPPHPQMALVQSLLVRALVARFWEEPYSGRLVRWGTDLYDRYLLPWYVRADIHDVVADLRRHDIDFDIAWLEPFLEFRFPLVGEVEMEDVRLELRNAIEPWHVLGEEVAGVGHGPVRRLLDRASPGARSRASTRPATSSPATTCPVPLQPTSTSGTGVAGVRFKAWAPVVGAASDDRCARSARVRSDRPLELEVGRRMHLRDLASGWSVLRHVPRELRGSRGSSVQPVLQAWSHPRPRRRRRTRSLRGGGSSFEYSRTLDLRRHAPAESSGLSSVMRLDRATCRSSTRRRLSAARRRP